MKSWVADAGDSQAEPCGGNVSNCIGIDYDPPRSILCLPL